ncbi:sterol desaturase family protein [Variovorax paradoxus]|uniref:Sterol desaturase family protein n=1 Tax=Variovorax paradoxus TaxID=34073 RepID=A0A6I6HJ71_VARPD|nr:sterol desaturase family protein [Variovorax paradoxus]QGW82911.1 sterol desaturase family protein [Variovorax paradoxus]
MNEPIQFVIDSLWYQLDAAKELILITLGGVLFAVLGNQQGWKNEIRRLHPSSLRINLIVYIVDILIVAVPVSMLVRLIYQVLSSHGLILFSTVLDVWPVWIVGLLCVATGDFIGYWRHRFEHSPLLWSAHSLHHSDEEMTWFTLFRFHPLNRVSTAAIDYGALFLLGFPLWAIAFAGSVRHFYGMFVHINRPWTLGFLGWILVSPAMHRWHHVRAGPGMFSNYATVFSLFDRMFGTIYAPGPCHDRLGVEGVNQDEYVSQMLLPIARIWRMMGSLKVPGLRARVGKN